jgi:translation initiation factor 1
VGKKRIATDDSSSLTNNPFAGLGDALGEVADEGPAPEPSSPEAPDRETAPDLFGPKVVVRREKKGRGGKTATVIEGLRGTEANLDDLAADLRKHLGCGVRREGSNIVAQGAQTDRVRQWLVDRGARNVVVGN